MDSNEKNLKHVVVYTDGACAGNPGPGGYGSVLIYENKRRELTGAYRHTTNNRMELMAAIAALRILRYPCSVTLFSDSKYLVDCMELGWAKKWRENGWKRLRNKSALNCDLWDVLLGLCDVHCVKFQWLKGHAGQELNERCDALALSAIRQQTLIADENYEKLQSPEKPNC